MMLYVPAYTHERRPYSATLYSTIVNFGSLLGHTISAQCKSYGWCSTPGPLADGDFLKKICAGVVGTRTDWVLNGEEGGMTTQLLQYVTRFDGRARFLGLEGEIIRRVGRGALCLSDSRLYLLRQAASN